MEKNHVVVDLDTFIALKDELRDANNALLEKTLELDEIKKHCFVIDKEHMSFQENYKGDNLYLAINRDKAKEIALQLFKDSNFTGKYEGKLTEFVCGESVKIGDFELFFKKSESESEEGEK